MAAATMADAEDAGELAVPRARAKGEAAMPGMGVRVVPADAAELA